jgi:nitrite reductase/ring-hydroxylating ferredoxin subunit
MNRKLAITIVLLSVVAIFTACAGQAAAADSRPVSTAPVTQPVSVAAVPATSQPQQAPAAAPAAKPSGPVKAKEITPTVSGDIVTVPVSVVQSNWNNHFLVNTPGGTMGFMAYVLDGQIYVRASICPPCRGKTYTLDGSTLVCDTCGTTFNARTGLGIAGPCVNFPKASVQYTVADGNLVMKIGDLSTAYQNTLKPGKS